MKTSHNRHKNVSPSLRGRAGVGLLCLIFCGCVTDFEPKGIDEISSILVVEGIITDDETTITLSRSVNLLSDDFSSTLFVPNAQVYVDCDDKTQCQFERSSCWGCYGRYTIKTGKLDPKRKYRLRIEIEEPEHDCVSVGPCPNKIYEYCSDYTYPIQTPEIDSVFWIKRGKGQPVMIHVATHSPHNEVLYYRWSYSEDWEYSPEYYYSNDGSCPWCRTSLPENVEFCPRCKNKAVFHYNCWGKANSATLLLGSAEKTVFGKLTEKIIEFPPTSRKISSLYRVDVKQNAISKRAYDYFTNIKRNSENTGSLFAPVPSELRGNIACITDPGRPVIGYIDISTSTYKRRYISRSENLYELPYSDCDALPIAGWCEKKGVPSEECTSSIVADMLVFNRWVPLYTYQKCVDCTYHGDTTDKPYDWPN